MEGANMSRVSHVALQFQAEGRRSLRHKLDRMSVRIADE